MSQKMRLGVLVAMIVSPAALDVQANEFELGAGVPYFLFDSKLETHDKFGLRLFAGTRINKRWGVELVHDRINTEFDVGGDLDVRQTALNGLFYGDMIGKVEPYITAGWGQATFSSLSDEDTTVTNFGGGVKYYISKSWVLRPSVNYFLPTELDDGYSSLSISISYLINHQKPPASKPAIAPAAKQDTDRDGVIDEKDRCLQTPKGVNVDASGCPLDDDGDGVFNYQDKCPETAEKLKVDNVGCPVVLTETVEIDLKVNFDSNSAVVKPEYFSEIQRVAIFLEQYENTTVVIEGHTDTSGSAVYNKSLSQKRADAVAKVLVSEMAIKSSRVKSIGYGEERPIADESTPSGRQANRRVVAKVSTSVKSVQKK